MKIISENWNVCSLSHSNLKTSFTKVSQFDQLNENMPSKKIKSFCHNLFLTSDQKTSFANIFQFGNWNKTFTEKNEIYVHLVTN